MRPRPSSTAPTPTWRAQHDDRPAHQEGPAGPGEGPPPGPQAPTQTEALHEIDFGEPSLARHPSSGTMAATWRAPRPGSAGSRKRSVLASRPTQSAADCSRCPGAPTTRSADDPPGNIHVSRGGGDLMQLRSPPHPVPAGVTGDGAAASRSVQAGAAHHPTATVPLEFALA